MSNALAFKRLVMQPTSLCNVNCSYCYLAHRAENRKMNVRVAERVAESLGEKDRGMVRILWHGGEPLACGIAHFRALLEPFEALRKAGIVRHSIQTNGTLVTDEWCSLFIEREIHIGVSIDGPQWANRNRIDWAGNEIFARVMRGIKVLQRNGILFSSICVVDEKSIGCAKELYGFFTAIGCDEVGFNLEEKLGVHVGSAPDTDDVVTRFWSELYVAWREDPRIQVREFTRTLRWIENPANPYEGQEITDIFPCIAHNGKTVLLSPEFLDAWSEIYRDFAAGNVLNESLDEIVARSMNLQYVKDFKQGVKACAKSCGYFEFCRGGQASNKYFEIGSTDATETVYCRNTEQRLLEAVLSSL